MNNMSANFSGSGPAEELSPPKRSSWPTFGADEIEAATDVLKSGKVNSLHHGTQCAAFEQAMAEFCGVPHAIAVANGTLALELALQALDIGQGDEVIVPARSFLATASCVAACGAKVVFADVDYASQNVTAETIAAALTPQTKAVIVVHLAGWPCEMGPIMDLAREHGLFVIEDCAQAHGAKVDGQPVGSFGDAGAFSFCTDKIISTGGEGGMLVMKSREIWKKAWAYKDHGKDPDEYRDIVPGPDFLWLHSSLGSNFRLTEFQCAIGLLQLGKLAEWTAARQANSQSFEAQLADLDAVEIARPRDGLTHARYKYYLTVRPEKLRTGVDRREIIKRASAAGLAVSTGSCPEMYREAAFDGTDMRPAAPLPVAQKLGETTLMVQVDQTLSEEDLRNAGLILRQIILEATA